jgi:hypothetical protein
MASLSDFQARYQVSGIADPDIEAFPDRTDVRGGITEARCHDVIRVGESVPVHCEALLRVTFVGHRHEIGDRALNNRVPAFAQVRGCALIFQESAGEEYHRH